MRTLYTRNFGGKLLGRYKISRDDLKTLAQRSALKIDFLASLSAELRVEHHLIFISIGDGTSFGVIEEAKVDGWRPVPTRLVKQFAVE